MRQRHDDLLAAVDAERGRLASRRGALVGGAALAIAALARPAFAQEATPEADQAQPSAPDLAVERDFADDLDVLNYALTLEHLENAFYRDGVGLFDFGVDPFGNAIGDYLLTIGQHEATHVATLTEVITGLGGTPVAEQAYDFSAAYADPAAFLQTAQALENVGVAAYDGAGAAISDPRPPDRGRHDRRRRGAPCLLPQRPERRTARAAAVRDAALARRGAGGGRAVPGRGRRRCCR
jgi:hypothetical protein